MSQILYSPSPDLETIGKGRVFLDRFTAAGVRSGNYIHLGNCSKFSIGVKPDVKKSYNSMTHSAGVYKTATARQDLSAKMEGFELSPDAAAIAMMSDLPTMLTQTGGSVSAETLAAAGLQKHGRMFQTAEREVSALVLTQGATTLVNNVDYVLYDAHAGIVYFPELGAVADTSAVTAAYTAGAVLATANQAEVLGAQVSSVRGQLLFVGDPTTGTHWEVLIPRAFLTPNGDQDFISEDFMKWAVDATIEDNSSFDPTIPYFRAIRVTNA